MRWFLILGGLGLLAFVPEFVDERAPDVLLMVGMLLAIIAAYGALILRGRARGESALESLQIQYGARLTAFERGFWLVLGIGLIALALPVMPTWEFGGMALMGVYAIWIALSGKPPFAVSRKAADESRPRS